jgi:hypothetical protein
VAVAVVAVGVAPRIVQEVLVAVAMGVVVILVQLLEQ